MILLKIKQPGLVLRLNQIKKEVRTPTELNVTNQNIDKLIRELRNYGINDFELKTVSDLEQNYHQKTKEALEKNKVDSKQKVNEQEERLIDIEQVLDKLPCDQVSDQLERITKKIEFALDELNNKIDSIKDSKPEIEEPKSKFSKKFTPDEPDDEFIPSISLDGLEKHGNNSHKEIESDKNTDKADSLSKKLGNKKE